MDLDMDYICYYKSPMGGMVFAADDIGLMGVWFDDQKGVQTCLKRSWGVRELPIFEDVKRWLEIYFSGKEPDFTVKMHLIGTEFQKEVWEILATIPYGKTISYGEIAKQLAAKKGLKRMSPQAVGGAVGHNNISILVPCHRVIGSDGSLTGYAGGMDRKRTLLTLEQAEIMKKKKG